MTYDKPEVTDVKLALTRVRSSNIKGPHVVQDSAYPIETTLQTSAAYEADE